MDAETAGGVISDDIVPAGRPWGKVVKHGEVLRIIDLHGQQAVDFLCYDAHETSDRYSAANTMKMQNNVYVGKGTVLYSEGGNPLFTVVEDTCGSHDTLAGCCSDANNFLRYGIRNTPNCYSNFPISSRFSASSVSAATRSSPMLISS
jgi:uncharacterized protein YcgI (DUF1989 family)